MEAIASAAPISLPREPANYDEVSMQQSMLFSDSLKDLKNLRKQLYSAAEYFELSYSNDDDQKHIVVHTLKDYAIRALVNTVDHLGSVSYKVNDLMDEKVDEVSGIEQRMSCIEQRLKSCQKYIDREGLSEQSLVINIPKFHKRYILPVGETIKGLNGSTKLKYQGCSLDDEDDWQQFRNSVRASIRETPSSTAGHSISPSPRLSQLQPGSFSFSGTTSHRKESERRTVSPHRFPLLRSGSFASRQTTPKKSRPTTPNSRSRPTTPNPSRQYPSEPRKSASMRLHADRENSKDTEQNPSKSKRLLKALLSRRKSRKDDMLYTYLDEY